MKISPIGGAVARHRGEGARIGDHQALKHGVGDALARFPLGALGIGECVPCLVPGADGDGAVGFGQAIDMGDVEAEPLHAFDDGGGRRGAGGHHADPAIPLRAPRRAGR